VNLVLAVFNLPPGAPLDGGRLAMAVLWRLRGDRLEATRLATGLGQLLGYGLVGFGLVELVVGADLGGLWSIVLGIFLSSAASAERRGAEESELLADIRVGEVMTRDPMRVPGSLTVETFVTAALGQGRSPTWLLSGPGGVVTGILPIDRLAGVRGAARATTRLEAVALPLAEVPVAAEDERLLDLLERLPRGVGSRALAFEAGELVGIVTPEDVARAVQVARLRGRPGGSVGASTAAPALGADGREDPARP
jgi:CBS domain-containing protein